MSTQDLSLARLEAIADVSAFEQLEMANLVSADTFPKKVSNGIGNGIISNDTW